MSNARDKVDQRWGQTFIVSAAAATSVQSILYFACQCVLCSIYFLVVVVRFPHHQAVSSGALDVLAAGLALDAIF